MGSSPTGRTNLEVALIRYQPRLLSEGLVYNGWVSSTPASAADDIDVGRLADSRMCETSRGAETNKFKCKIIRDK